MTLLWCCGFLESLRYVRFCPRCHSGVTRCYSGVTIVLPWCYNGVTVVLQCQYNGVTCCYDDVVVVLRYVRFRLRCHSGVTILI
jgi:hypothetical protein